MKHLVLTLLGLLSFSLAIRAEVYSGECGDNGNNLTWTLDTETGKLVISGNGDITQNPWIDYRYYIRSVDIQEGVKSIGDNAFRSCYLITNARIPDSVIDIGDNAFYDCFGLKSIVIGRSVTSIGIRAFTLCSNLRTIINFSSLAITKGSTSNGSVAFNAYQVVSNPNSIEENFVFSIIDGVNTLMAYIGDDTKIVLPDNYRGEGYVIGENAFYSNLTVTSIVIPDNVTSIGDWAFFNCRLLESINIPNNITDIGDMAFRQCSKLKNIILSNTLRSVGYRIFYDCIELESMEIPNSVTSIGKEAFYNCVSLKDVTIGSNVMSICEYAFASCETLANVKMPCSITKIEEYAFNGCEALTFIIIPPSVTSLGRRIFEGCRNLKTIINLSSIQFIISSNDNYSHMPSYSDIIKIDAPNGSIEGDYVFGIIEGTNTLCKYLGNDSDIILPYNYKGGKYRIGAEAFSNNETISNVMIPDGIINIGNDAFEYCTSLTGITIPNSVTSIGNRAFYSCTALQDVYCHAEKVPSTEFDAFYKSNYSNATLHVPAGSIESYKTTAPWSSFGAIKALPQAMTIVDGEVFENDEEQTLSTLTYTRTLPNLYWNALYVPFEIPVSEIIDKYEVAYVNNVNSYDHNDDGTIDDMRMEVIKIKSGTLNANYPYLIKARNDEARIMNLTLENTTLFQSVETTIDCSSVFAKHEITGIYNKRYKNELPEGAMAISMAGAWQPIANGSYLNPFRLYMTITARDGSPVKVEPAAMSRIRISVLGEDVETDIEETRSETKNIILDLSGRSVQNPVKGGVYIVNGKKVIF